MTKVGKPSALKVATSAESLGDRSAANARKDRPPADVLKAIPPADALMRERPADVLRDQWPTSEMSAQIRSVDAPEPSINGYLLGGGPAMYPPTTSLSKIPPVVSELRQPELELQPRQRVEIIHVNGINSPARRQLEGMRAAATALSHDDGMQAELRGVHNSTRGLVGDIWKAARDKAGVGTNLPLDTLRTKILDRLTRHEPVNLLVHSHGALLAARALREAKLTLQMEFGRSKAEAEDHLTEMVRVVTLASASRSFPAGPRYLHLINTEDGVAMSVGLGASAEGVGKKDSSGLLERVAKGVVDAITHTPPGEQTSFGLESAHHQVIAFERNFGPKESFKQNHSFQDAYVPVLRAHAHMIMGTVDARGFYLSSTEPKA